MLEELWQDTFGLPAYRALPEAPKTLAIHHMACAAPCLHQAGTWVPTWVKTLILHQFSTNSLSWVVVCAVAMLAEPLAYWGR